MKRRLTAIIFLITLGLAFAQPPVDYTLLCEVEVDSEIRTSIIGAASYVDGELHVSLDEGVTCEGTLSVEQDDTLDVSIVSDPATGETTVTILTKQDAEGDVDLSGIAKTLPEEAIAGMVVAQENRAAAGTHRADAEAKADAARERSDERREEVEEDATEGPEAAIEHATEVGGGVGLDAKPDRAGEGRP